MAGRRVTLLALLGALGQSSACTSLLDIDGDYVLEETRADAGNGGSAPAGAGGITGVGGILPVATGGARGEPSAGGERGVGGEPGAGGEGPESGGEPRAGGSGAAGGEPGAGGDTSAGGSGAGGAVVPEAGTDGCRGACPPDPCSPGTYAGTFTGYHTPSLELIPVIPALNRIDVAGTVSITLGAGATGTLTVTSGRFTGKFQVTGDVPFTADVTGTLDCSSRRFDGRLTNGEGGVVNNFEFAGTATATGDVTLQTLDGTWSEEEVTPRVLNARGTGTFRVTRE